MSLFCFALLFIFLAGDAIFYKVCVLSFPSTVCFLYKQMDSRPGLNMTPVLLEILNQWMFCDSRPSNWLLILGFFCDFHSFLCVRERERQRDLLLKPPAVFLLGQWGCNAYCCQPSFEWKKQPIETNCWLFHLLVKTCDYRGEGGIKCNYLYKSDNQLVIMESDMNDIC